MDPWDLSLALFGGMTVIFFGTSMVLAMLG